MNIPDTILLTGANGQSAIHLAEKLLAQNCRLMLLYHNRTDRLEKLVNVNTGKCFLHKVDLTDHQAVCEVYNTITEEAKSHPGALIHTAAIRSFDAKPLSESEPAVWTRIFNANVSMAYNILRCVLPPMQQTKKGKIVLFGSNVTRTGLPYGTAYAAAKAALVNLVRSTAWEVAEHNIQINIVSPAPLDTDPKQDYQGDYLEFRKQYFEAYIRSHPAHRLVKPDDVTQTVMSLLNQELTYLSGEEIFLTGGVL